MVNFFIATFLPKQLSFHLDTLYILSFNSVWQLNFKVFNVSSSIDLFFKAVRKIKIYKIATELEKYSFWKRIVYFN